MSGSTPSNSYFGSSGVLPELLYLVCGSAPTKMVQEGIGSTPVLTNMFLGPLLWEHSHKNGIALLGVLPNNQKLYIGSRLDMIYNLDILLPLDTLGVLPEGSFFLSGSTPRMLILLSGSTLGICVNKALPLTKNKPSGSTLREQK